MTSFPTTVPNIRKYTQIVDQVGNLMQVPRLTSKAYSALAGYDTAAAFTVTGDVMVRVIGVVGATAITSTSGTTTLAVGTAESTGGIIAATTVDNTGFAATDVWTDATVANDVDAVPSTWFVVGGGTAIVLTRSVDDILGGILTLYCQWMPLSADGNVVAA